MPQPSSPCNSNCFKPCVDGELEPLSPSPCGAHSLALRALRRRAGSLGPRASADLSAELAGWVGCPPPLPICPLEPGLAPLPVSRSCGRRGAMGWANCPALPPVQSRGFPVSGNWPCPASPPQEPVPAPGPQSASVQGTHCSRQAAGRVAAAFSRLEAGGAVEGTPSHTSQQPPGPEGARPQPPRVFKPVSHI